MSEKLFNEAEQYLLGRWADAFLMQEQMEKVRSKYKDLCQKIVTAVKELHGDLDAAEVYPHQFWGSGTVGLGKKAWPNKKSTTGFWLENIRLEVLLDEAEAPPIASVYVDNRDWSGDLGKLKSDIRNAAPGILSKDEQARWKREDTADEGVILWYELPESKKDLLRMLSEGDGQAYLRCLVAHFESMARFIPVLDEAFLKKK